MKAVLTFCGALLAIACHPGPPASVFPDARAAIDRMQEVHACSRALRGEARLDYFDDDGRMRVKTLFLSQHPQNVRFDLLSPFGSPLATLTVNDDEFALLDQKEKAFYVGPASECNVERFLRVPIPPAALVQLLAGEAPILLHEPGAARVSWEQGQYTIRIAGKHQATQIVKLSLPEADRDKPYGAQSVRVTEVIVMQAGVELYRAELSEHVAAETAKPRVDPEGIEADVLPSGPSCRAEVPRRVRFVVPVSERDVIFEQLEVVHNPPLIGGVFTQQQPGGTVRRRSLCR